MKLRNKKTGEIVDLYEGLIREDGERITIKPVAVLEKCYIYHSLAELNEEWEDYEEPKEKEYYCIDYDGEVKSFIGMDVWQDKIKPIGNYFETEEEAEKAVERLRAWKRLKDKGFKFKRWQFLDNRSGIWVQGNLVPDIVDELDILFGGEE